jgi:hypothetical protein
MLGIVPELRDAAWANRGFHQRAASWIADQGIRQFLDIGSGLPAIGNTHEVVRRFCPDARVVYVDSDPLVEDAYAGQLDGHGDRVGVLCADPRDPDAILEHPRVRALIDPGQPVGLLMTRLLNFVEDEPGPRDLLDRYVRHAAPGSYLALSQITDEAKPPMAVEGVRSGLSSGAEHLHFRKKREVARLFEGLELVPPYAGSGPEIAYCGIWGAEDVRLADSEGSRWIYCGVARIP